MGRTVKNNARSRFVRENGSGDHAEGVEAFSSAEGGFCARLEVEERIAQNRDVQSGEVEVGERSGTFEGKGLAVEREGIFDEAERALIAFDHPSSKPAGLEGGFVGGERSIANSNVVFHAIGGHGAQSHFGGKERGCPRFADDGLCVGFEDRPDAVEMGKGVFYEEGIGLFPRAMRESFDGPDEVEEELSRSADFAFLDEFAEFLDQGVVAHLLGYHQADAVLVGELNHFPSGGPRIRQRTSDEVMFTGGIGATCVREVDEGGCRVEKEVGFEVFPRFVGEEADFFVQTKVFGAFFERFATDVHKTHYPHVWEGTKAFSPRATEASHAYLKDPDHFRWDLCFGDTIQCSFSPCKGILQRQEVNTEKRKGV